MGASVSSKEWAHRHGNQPAARLPESSLPWSLQLLMVCTLAPAAPEYSCSRTLQHLNIPLPGPLQLHSASPDPREDTEAFAQLLQLCTPRLHQFDAHGLAIIVRTAAKLDVRLPQEVLDGWAAAAAARLPEFNTQDLANSIFSRK